MPVLFAEKKPSLNNKEFKNIFEKHYLRVYRLLTCFLSNRSTAEDIAQETFLRFYLTPPRDFDNVGGWLTQVAKNLAFNYLHREKSRAVRESHLELPLITEPELRLEEEEEKNVISQALHSLSERDRVCLTLRLSGMSYSEIAQAIEVKETSVGTILARAKERFKAEYLKLKGRDD